MPDVLDVVVVLHEVDELLHVLHVIFDQFQAISKTFYCDSQIIPAAFDATYIIIPLST